MEHKAISIRPFIGAKDFSLSRTFYRDLGFQETLISARLCLFRSGDLGFYLQDAYVAEWIENTMVFMEVENATQFYDELLALDLPGKYEGVKLVPLRVEQWGRECFLHDPSGVLWHFGDFFNRRLEAMKRKK
jgi:hypothetical protein